MNGGIFLQVSGWGTFFHMGSSTELAISVVFWFHLSKCFGTLTLPSSVSTVTWSIVFMRLPLLLLVVAIWQTWVNRKTQSLCRYL